MSRLRANGCCTLPPARPRFQILLTDMATNRDDEYEIQFYGFCTKDFYEFVKASVHAEIRNEVQRLTGNLVERQSSEDSKKIVQKAGDDCIEKYINLSREPLSTLSRQLSTFFGLPKHVLLPVDKLQRSQYTQNDEEKVKNEISKLKSRYRRARYLKECFESEINLGSQMESKNRLLGKVLDKLNAQDIKDIHGKLHKVIQHVLGLEVVDASLKLSEHPSCAECDETLINAVIQSYNQP